MRGRSLPVPALRNPLLACLLVACGAAAARADVITASVHVDAGAVRRAATLSKPGTGEAAVASVAILIPRGHLVRHVEGWARTTEPGLAPAAAQAPEPPLASLGSMAAWHGYQIALVHLEPLRSRGPSWEIATEVDLVLETEPGGELPIAPLRRNEAREKRCRDLVRSLVANPEQVESFAPEPGRKVEPGHGFSPTAFPDLEGSDVEYVIVTSAALASSFQALADWKTRRGVPAVVRTIESIQAAYRSGSDVQETLRRFLQDAYQKWSIDWVLLGGDTDVLPARFLASSFGLSAPELIPSDLYFAGLDGNWNADSDALWGEAAPTGQPDPDGGDLLAEVYVSRAPVTSPEEVDAFVEKVIAYEFPADATYQTNTLFLGEVLFPTNWDSTQAITMDGAQLSEDIIAQRFPPGTPVIRRYEDYVSFPGSLPLNRSSSLSYMQSGFNIVNHIGHGFRYNMSVADGSIVNSDADGLANSNRYSILNILNCTSLAFDYSCLGEHFINNPIGGAVAVVGASRSAYPLPAREYQDDWYDLLFNQGVWHLGELVARSRLNQTPLAATESAHRWSHYIYNVLGDPELAVYSGQPQAVTVNHPPGAGLGAQSLLVEVLDGAAQPVVGARVCLQKGLEDYAVGTTGADGRVTLDFAPESSGNLDLTVSGRNLQTWLGTIPVAAAPAVAYVHLQSVTVDDDASGGTNGNGNGVLDAGETVDLRFTLRNDGAAASGPVTGTVSETDPWVNVTVGGFSAPALGVGASALTTGSVRIQMLAGGPDHHVFELQLAMNDGTTATTDRLAREMHAPSLQLVRLEVLDAVYGNGNGTPDEGEIFDLRCWVKNYGSGRVDGLNAVLQTSNPLVTIYQGSGSYGTIQPMTEAAPAVLFQLSEDVLAENIINLRLTDNRGRLVIEPFELRRPDPPALLTLDPSTSPTIVLVTWPPVPGADVAGYHVYRALSASGPWTRTTVDYTGDVAYFRDTGLQTNARYYYKVTTVDASGNQSEPSAVYSVSTNPPQLVGFPISMSAETSSSPAVGDIDGDGLPEIVQGDARLYAWHGNGQEVLDADNDAQSWGVFSDLPGTINASVLLVDIDHWPGLEVVAANWFDNGVFVFGGNGALRWSHTPVNGGQIGYWGTPAAADVDADGWNEIFAPSKDGRLYAWNHDGTPLLASPDGTFATHAAYSRSSPALGNLDADPELEVVLTDVAGNLWAWNADGTPLPGFPKVYGVAFYNSPVLGDVDGDGDVEIVAIHQSGANNLHCLRGDGTELAGFPITVVLKSPAVSPTPALADLDGDGRLEIVVASTDWAPANGKVFVYRWNGTAYPGWPQVTGTDSESSPVVADLDGDGLPDIAHGGQDGVLRGWKRDGTELLGFPLSVGDFIRGTPAVADVDGDGGTDLVIAGWDRNLYVWDLPGAYNAQQAQWPAFLHDAQRTKLHGYLVDDATDAGDGLDPQASPPRRLELAPNHPNPFNPTTSIAFALPAAGAVRLDVFDVGGRRLCTLQNGFLAAGWHRLAWDGTDARGLRLASGVYLLRLDWNGDQRLRRLVLLK